MHTEQAVVCDQGMAIVVGTPEVDELGEAVGALREWQHDEAPMQLHPGDLGWQCQFGPQVAAASVRTWSRGGRVLAVGMLDQPTLLRMTVAPDAQQDEELAEHLREDLTVPARGVLGRGRVAVEVPRTALVRELLRDAGWMADDHWSPLRRDLTGPLPVPDLRVEVVGPEQVQVRVDVQRASFDRSTFTVERWHAMAGGLPYAQARCLLGYDDAGNAVATVTVWSAGAGRPGLIEPLGVHREHRGHGHGRAVTLAAAVALQEMGSSSMVVCTPSSNVGAVATYTSAGMEPLAEVWDLYRPG